MKTVEDSVREALQSLSPCPKYDCVTAKAVSSLNCSIYGCNVSQEHSALYRICTELHVNGNLNQRRKVIGVVRKEVGEGRYQFREH